jgi:hypothetical protein
MANEPTNQERVLMKSAFISAAAALAVGMLSATSAHATIFVFTTPLSSAGEGTPTSTATGSATVSFNDVAGTVAVNLSWTGLATATPFGHIHCCTTVAGTGNASVSLDFGAITQAATGSFSASYSPATFATLLAGVQAGKAYVNIHTPGTYAGGEIRGFLAPVPEPQSWALMLGGMAALGALARKRAA